MTPGHEGPCVHIISLGQLHLAVQQQQPAAHCEKCTVHRGSTCEELIVLNKIEIRKANYKFFITEEMEVLKLTCRSQ